MSRRRELDAIVVGAGPVGAAAALALCRDGFRIALVETREPKPWDAADDVDLRVIALAPDGRDLLDDLGVWSTIVAARAHPYRHMRVWDALAPGELAFDAADRGEAALGFIVENRLVQHKLWQSLERQGSGEEGSTGRASARNFPSRVDAGDEGADAAGQRIPGGNARVLCPAAVVSIDNGDASVGVTLDDGTHLDARLLIAGDGAQSPTRALLGIDFSGRDYGQRAVVAHVATERGHADSAWQRFLPGGPLAFLPLADGRCSIVWSLPEPEAARILALDDAAFRAELGCAFDFRLGNITATTPRAAFPLHLRMARRHAAGRCVLIGDAAHIVHPLAGQGMNLGLRDVACLRRVLADARSGDFGAAHVLRRYERERRSENAVAARSLDVIQRVFDSDDLMLATLRGLGLGLVGRIAPLRQFFADAAAGRP